MGRPPALSLDRRVLAVAAAVVALLLAVSGRYGYHRDELYFLAAGRHLAWGYPDQPPLVPLLARGLSALAPGSLPLLRLPAALAVGALVVTTGAIARRLGADGTGQLVAAAAAAVCPVYLGLGHQLATATFAVLAWAVLLWLLVRLLAGGDGRLWLAAGVVAGVGLTASTLVGFLLLAVGAGIAVAGPRRLLASPWPWAGLVVAAAFAAPYVVWQARHGWPQVAESRAIANGASGSSQPRGLFVPFQVLQVGVWLTPLWVAGLWRLLRDPALRWCRALGWVWPVLVVVFVATGGKPYYLVGVYPLLFAAGAVPCLDWLRRRRRPRAIVAGVLALSVPGAFVALPLLPVRTFGSVRLSAIDYDAGEQVAWPAYVHQIAAAYRATGAEPAVVTSNYGEAGAIDHYGRPLGLPTAHSGQTGYWYWGPPRPRPTTLAVGFPAATLARWFGHCALVGRLHNDVGVDNDEQDAPLWWCRDQRAAWTVMWPTFRHT